MKDRITLIIIIASLWIFLFVFQNYMSTFWALVCLCIFMVLYASYMQVAFNHQKRKLKKKPLIINHNYKPFVSVLIPAHNEETVITETIEHVLKQDYPNFEIIVIDDRSTDKTATVINEIALDNFKVRILIRKKNAFPGKSAVLNDAMNIANGEVVLVLDSDATIEPDFLTNLVPALEPQDVGAVQARKIIKNSSFNFLTRCQNNEYALDTHFQIGRDAVKGAVELRGNGELIKREALKDINGWNNYTITDDLDMSTRLQIKGWDVRFLSNVKVYEEGVIDVFSLVKQRRRWIEGSIRRYLENFSDVLFSKDMALRVSLDMTAYLTEVILPFWVVSEIMFQAFKVIKGVPNTIYSSLFVLFSIGICFILVGTYSIRRFNKKSILISFLQAIETCVYLIALWFPLVTCIVFKIIFMEKNMNWGKTKHGVDICLADEAQKIKEEQDLVGSKR